MAKKDYTRLRKPSRYVNRDANEKLLAEERANSDCPHIKVGFNSKAGPGKLDALHCLICGQHEDRLLTVNSKLASRVSQEEWPHLYVKILVGS